MSTLEELEPVANWFRIFEHMVKSGSLKDMGPAAVVVYLIIKAHVHWKTGTSFPSIETIVDLSGLSDRTVYRALDKLEKLRYISRETYERDEDGEVLLIEDAKGRRRRSRSKRRNEYKLIEHIETRSGLPVEFEYVPAKLRQWLDNFAAEVYDQLSKRPNTPVISINININGDVILGDSHGT